MSTPPKKRTLRSPTASPSPTTRRPKKLSHTKEELEVQIAASEAEVKKSVQNFLKALDSEKDSELKNNLIVWVMEMDQTIRVEGYGLRQPPGGIGKYGSCGHPSSLTLKLTGVMLDRLAQMLYQGLKSWTLLKSSLASVLPSPHEFAIKKVWKEVQAHQSEILCRRPTERTGLPLSTLHDVFRQFQRDVTMPFHPSPDSMPAAHAAKLLVLRMCDAFNNEGSRSSAFNECLRLLFTSDRWISQYWVSPEFEVSRSVIDAAYLFGGEMIPFILREDKDEVGSSGDPSMQLARGYHMFVKTLRDRKVPWALNTLDHGAPTFLISVLGESNLQFISWLKTYRGYVAHFWWLF